MVRYSLRNFTMFYDGSGDIALSSVELGLAPKFSSEDIDLLLKPY